MTGRSQSQSELKCSPPVPTLVDLSEEAEMIVVGCNGRGAVARVLLGSVSSGVVRSASCPVAVIRDEAPLHASFRSSSRAGGNRLLAGVGACAAVAFDEASRRGVELTALHAWSDAALFELPWLTGSRKRSGVWPNIWRAG